MLHPITTLQILFSNMCVQRKQIDYECETKQFCKKQNDFIIHVKQEGGKLCNKCNMFHRMAMGINEVVDWKQQNNCKDEARNKHPLCI